MTKLALITLSKALLVAVSLSACSPEPAAFGPQVDAGATHDGDATDSASEVDEDDSTCSDGDTRSCPCGDGGVGEATCQAGEFGACRECSYDVPSKCIPGTYEGRVMGTYRSIAAGIPEIIAPSAQEDNNQWLLYLEPPEAGEFATVGRGCVHVLDAAGGTDDGKARFYLNGQLDCATGEFTGEIRGHYESTSLGGTKRYFYKGKVKGTFDVSTKSFVNGMYEVREPEVLIPPQPGGKGTFELRYTGAEPPDDRSDQEGCVGSDFPADDVFPEVML